MRTRIISGAVLVLIVGALVTFHLLTDIPYVMLTALALTVAVGVWELTKNAKLVTNKALIYAATVFGAVEFICYSLSIVFALYAAIVYVVVVVAICLFNYEKVDNGDIMSAVAIPVMLSFAFYCVIVVLTKGLFYLLLIINFSAICDCGAYFVGVTFGKHKLCPVISPKKTVEGALGGIAVSIIFTIILFYIFKLETGLLPLILITPVLCVVGMMGDLFASVIKRKAEIKDYGKLIPGHGGIMDRFDSILLIAPVFILLLSLIRG